MRCAHASRRHASPPHLTPLPALLFQCAYHAFLRGTFAPKPETWQLLVVSLEERRRRFPLRVAEEICLGAAHAKIRFMRAQRIAILIFDDFEPLDVWGFTEAFTIARFLGSSEPPVPFEVVLVAAEKRPIRSSNGPKAMPDYDHAEALGQPFDVLMLSGGLGTRKIINDGALRNWLMAMDELPHLGRRLRRHRHGLPPRVPPRGRAVAENAVKAAEYDWHRDPQEPIEYPQQARVP